jgi:hypothetical protein
MEQSSRSCPALQLSSPCGVLSTSGDPTGALENPAAPADSQPVMFTRNEDFSLRQFGLSKDEDQGCE